jgi:hypothetical protein
LRARDILLALVHTAMKTTQLNLRTSASRYLALAMLLVLTSLGQPFLAHSQAGTASLVKPTVEARSAFATGIEQRLRQAGIDARVQLDGDQRDVLHVEWQGAGRRDIYALVNSAAVRSGAQPIGFRSIVFTSGAQRWDYDLARESMVWNPSQL